VRTEDELRKMLSDAAQRAAGPSPDARARVGRVVRRQRAWRVGAVAGVAIALAAFGIVTITRPDHRATVRVISPGPTPSPSAVPGPEPDTGVSSPTVAGADVPAGFSAVSVTFVSPKDGFVLGSARCATGPCTAVLRTGDAGKTWHRIGAPVASVLATGPAPQAISRIRFATVNDGWAFGPELWATHDGGGTWTSVGLGGAAAGQVLDLEASAGTVHLVTIRPAGDQYRYEIWSSGVGRDDWYRAATTFPHGAAPVQDARFVLHGTDGWLVINERVVYAGAMLHQRTWSRWTPPCADLGGPATATAPTSKDVVAVCQEGQWGGSGPPQTRLHVSTDGGATFARVGPDLPEVSSSPASPTPQTIAITSVVDGVPEIRASFDGGQTWAAVYRGPSNDFVSELGFTTATQGIAVVAGPNGSSGALIMTTDSGHHWRTVPFRSSG